MINLVNVEQLQEEIEAVIDYLSLRCTTLVPQATFHHVGSTAIPGSLTKGDVDTLLEVEPEQFQAARKILDGVFSHNPEMAPQTDFVSYCGSHRGRDFGIQLARTCETDFDFLLVRDALLASPELVQRYNHVKLSAHHGDMDAYRRAKSDFLEDLVNTAHRNRGTGK